MEGTVCSDRRFTPIAGESLPALCTSPQTTHRRMVELRGHRGLVPKRQPLRRLAWPRKRRDQALPENVAAVPGEAGLCHVPRSGLPQRPEAAHARRVGPTAFCLLQVWMRPLQSQEVVDNLAGWHRGLRVLQQLFQRVGGAASLALGRPQHLPAAQNTAGGIDALTGQVLSQCSHVRGCQCRLPGALLEERPHLALLEGRGPQEVPLGRVQLEAVEEALGQGRRPVGFRDAKGALAEQKVLLALPPLPDLLGHA
mmetsp:Transcript_8970/g.26373  ORF Transcript_8970/g.26373 Transcript_8970/m.26373 type:complete len:254 (-) Transcript_8970:589-1350(-)